ncbi:Hypothetical predicted protein [Octopus vulgaris]|uniref:Uncharacterized protein n=1 Tax=Octopus vulgaris TaxID=6645 RepID=A0AA36AGX4_OCTVU|nr:Hypothetical predicted protein [Octopus vulgaris]
MFTRNKLKLRIMCRIISKYIDALKLRDSKVQANLRNAIGEAEFDGTWAQFKTTIDNVGVKVLGLKNRKHRDWFDENDLQINKLLEGKLSCTKNTSVPQMRIKSPYRSLSKDKITTLKKDTTDENKWWSDISEKIQKAYNNKDLISVYHLIGQVFGPRSSFVVPLKSKDSCFLFKDHEGIMKRWTEHFTDLFYNPSVIDENVISNLPRKRYHS